MHQETILVGKCPHGCVTAISHAHNHAANVAFHKEMASSGCQVVEMEKDRALAVYSKRCDHKTA